MAVNVTTYKILEGRIQRLDRRAEAFYTHHPHALRVVAFARMKQVGEDLVTFC
jgi:hypothetical protein